jgi:enamine deaminase RidA (YjgF/YER057c/UK114 family)
MNEAYGEFFAQDKPARSTIVCQFPTAGIKVMIDCVAYAGS